MNFDEWMKTRYPAYRANDDSVFLRELRDVWFAATKTTFEQCANLCDERAMKFEFKTADAESYAEKTDLRSRAWDFSVLGAIMREQSE